MTDRTLLILAFLLSAGGSLQAQHDAQRDSVMAVARGDREGFAKAFQNPRNDGGIEETRMVNLLMLLAEDKTDDAIAYARESLALGLDPARLLVGAGGPLDKLRAHPDFAELPGVSEVGAIIHGPMVGDVTDTSAKVWVRTNGAREISAFVMVAKDGTETIEGVQHGSIRTIAESDFTGVLRFENLAPETDYVGRLVGDDEASAEFSFRTRPAAGSPAKFSIAFGGGAGFVPEYHGMWDTIASFGPDALLLLGDNVYIDDPEHSLTQHYCYHRRQSEPRWRSLVSKTPVYSIYDDHDFGDNDCEPGPAIDKPAWKRPVLEIFRQNWANPGYGGGEENPGCWYDFVIGDVHFFLIDGRYYRHRASGSMLGQYQKQWLLDGLANSEATFKVVCSNVPFTAEVKPGSKDTWDGYAKEREEIFSHIEKENIEGVFLVSADRHRTDLRYTERPGGYRLYEFMSSRLTNRHTHPVVETPGLVWGFSKECSFGLMEFDTTAEDPVVLFRCVDIDGVERERFELLKSGLSFR